MEDERLIQKFLSEERHITVADCDRLLTANGYILHKSRGSHRVYHKKGFISITVVVPKGTKYLKLPYVKQIIKDLKLEG
jgi:predicted RNA binding protein YcfA (HicA-like mRNA interferase family)